MRNVERIKNKGYNKMTKQEQQNGIVHASYSELQLEELETIAAAQTTATITATTATATISTATATITITNPTITTQKNNSIQKSSPVLGQMEKSSQVLGHGLEELLAAPFSHPFPIPDYPIPFNPHPMDNDYLSPNAYLL